MILNNFRIIILDLLHTSEEEKNYEEENTRKTEFATQFVWQYIFLYIIKNLIIYFILGYYYLKFF